MRLMSSTQSNSPDPLEKYLDKSKHLRDVQVKAKAHDLEEDARQERIKRIPPLEQCYNLTDFESVAKMVMK
ncbi:hypothetical protein BGX38DRAFT_1176133 [Terfezia claveryi]|nr:hypothetical protein BGX38DRAFT_1176133 [Terfezia claveryi]